MSTADVIPLRRPPMYERQYAVTLAATAASLDAFEEALDALPDACLLGSAETGCAALVFTVVGVDPDDALSTALAMLRVRAVAVPDGASVTVLQHAAESVA